MSSIKFSDNKPIVITLVVVLIVIIGMIGYFLISSDPEPVVTEQIAIPEVIAPTIVEAPEPEPEPEPEPAIVVEPEPEPAIEEEPIFTLPLLDDSDQLIRDGVVSLTRHESINAWLASSELIRKFVAFVDNIAHGQVAKESVRSLAPEGAFQVMQIDEKTFEIDPVSYNRYNLFTEVAISIDARRSAEFYHLLRPLVQKAYNELGYNNKLFDDVMFQAIGRLLETPVIEQPIRLVRPVVMYKYEDDKLESLSAAQKQLLRMGPRNTRRLQDKISEVALELRSILGR